MQREKIVAYLNSAHPENEGKAAFFEMLGFTRVDWQTLADALRNVAAAAVTAYPREGGGGLDDQGT